jgi:hypothetical protein
MIPVHLLVCSVFVSLHLSCSIVLAEEPIDNTQHSNDSSSKPTKTNINIAQLIAQLGHDDIE